MDQKDLQFLTIKDSLAISEDGGLTYEPVSNKTRVITRIHHEKGYKPGKKIRLRRICVLLV